MDGPKVSASATGANQGIVSTNSHNPAEVTIANETDDIGDGTGDSMAGDSSGGGGSGKYRIPRKDGKTGSSKDQGQSKGHGGDKKSKAGGSGSEPKKDDGRKDAKEAKGKGGKGQGRKPVALPEVPDWLRKQWAEAKQCLGCGASNHYWRRCPLHPDNKDKKGEKDDARPVVPSKSGSQTTSGPKKAGRCPASSGKTTGSTGKSTGKTRGEKRSRDSAPTGSTPPAKAARKPEGKKFSYAAVTAGAAECVVVTKDHGHIAHKDFIKLRDAVEDRWLEIVSNGEKPFAVEKWSYSPTLATVFVSDEASGQVVKGFCEAAGLVLILKAELMEERKPTTVLTGLVTGSAAKRSREQLELFIKYEKENLGIGGRLEYYSTIETKGGNILLRILVDDEAKKDLSRHDFQFKIGASGLVKFEDEKRNKKVDASTRAEKLALLEKNIAANKKLLLDLTKARKEVEECETESIGSVGMSSLTMNVLKSLRGEDTSVVVDEETKMQE